MDNSDEYQGFIGSNWLISFQKWIILTVSCRHAQMECGHMHKTMINLLITSFHTMKNNTTNITGDLLSDVYGYRDGRQVMLRVWIVLGSFLASFYLCHDPYECSSHPYL